MGIAFVENLTMEEAEARLIQGLEEAKGSGKWMGIVWYVNEEGKLQMKRSSWQFPPGDMKMALEMLQDDGKKELTRLQGLDDSPLKTADFLPNFQQRRSSERSGDSVPAPEKVCRPLGGGACPDKESRLEGNDLKTSVPSNDMTTDVQPEVPEKSEPPPNRDVREGRVPDEPVDDLQPDPEHDRGWQHDKGWPDLHNEPIDEGPGGSP